MLKRTQWLNKGSSSLAKRVGLKKSKYKLQARKKSAEQVQQDKEDQERMWRLFERHWQSKKHYCESCGAWLGNENKNLYHDHLLEKGNPRYEHLKYEIDNLYLCCWICHDKKGNGFPTEEHKLAIEMAKEKLGDI